MFKPFKELKQVLEDNRKAAESLAKTADRCVEPKCDIPRFHENRLNRHLLHG